MYADPSFLLYSLSASMLLIGRNGEEAVGGVFVMLGWNLGIWLLSRNVYSRYRVKYDGAGI